MAYSHLVSRVGLRSDEKQGGNEARGSILFPFSQLGVCFITYDIVKAESMCDGGKHKGDAHSLVCFHGVRFTSRCQIPVATPCRVLFARASRTV